ncbi:transglutaminase family protein [Spirosoma fluviale]|uniref:Transglutaminase-like enzyme, putative cysteine protease n=1 Tax=Spirosoma fluviale TaxID=1597977 RepID=A0A286G0I4_9BACT|nr:transglutaminase family protein [Spirosoma fluviale]SOD89041.1 Transglutaminase-like enzyme, putative cysteine protease [Spirosoma fluviale]
MSVRVAIHHHTRYDYDRVVFLSPHLIRLRPVAHSKAIIESYTLTIQPANHVIHWQQDPFGNFIARVDFWEPMSMMSIDVDITARLEPVNPFDFFLDTYAQSFPFTYDAQLRKGLLPYMDVGEPGTQFSQWLQSIDRSTQGTIDFLIKLNQKVVQDIAYTTRMEPGVQTPDETLELAIGSCRDSGWLLVQALRHVGLAARFVSGYLAQVITAETKQNDPTKEHSLALHAWAEVFIPGAGWIGLDPTSGMLATEGHIPLACTPDPDDAAPVTGTTDVNETTFSYENTLEVL